MIMNYLENRKQYVQLNTNRSQILLTGDKSVSQGSVASGLLYLIYTLDIPHQSHKLKHSNHREYSSCKNTLMNTYVDDCYSVLTTKKNNIWKKIKNYIITMNNYYTNNRLQMNVKKTNVMVISNDKIDLENSIEVNGNNIKHVNIIKVLGNTFNCNLNWNSHINEGRGSLVFQLKQRLNSLKVIANKVILNFSKQLANAILISKLNYNIEVWGDTSLSNLNKIDKIMLNAAKLVLGNKCLGRTNKWIMDNMKWTKTKEKYENAMTNSIYKTINSKNYHYFKNYLTSNRNVRQISQNKVGHHDQSMGHHIFTQRTFLYKSINLYNGLPRNLTLIKKTNLFKKWSKRYYLDKNTILKNQEDNVEIIIQPSLNQVELDRCFDEEEIQYENDQV